MKAKTFILCACGLPFMGNAQVTVEKGAELFLGKNTELVVQGDFESKENIGGEGAVVLNGTSTQSVDLHHNQLPQLLVENRYDVTLASPLTIDKAVILKTGHLILGQHDLYLGAESAVKGSPTAYIGADNGGKVIKSVAKDLQDFIIPVGTRNAYTPLLIKSRGSYQNGLLVIGTGASASPNKPAASKDYLEHYWSVSRRGINGNLIATAFYGKVSGDERNIQPYYWNGHEWVGKESPTDTRNKLLSIDIPEGSGQIYAMRKGDELSPAEASITLLPNPVKNTATLLIRSVSDENTAIRITDSRGGIVLTRRVVLSKGLNQVNINVMSLADGYYTISSSMKNSRSVSMIKN